MNVLTLQQAARKLQVSDRHLRKLATEGRIPAFRCGHVWRIPEPMLDEWIRVQCQGSASGPGQQ